MWGCAVWFDQYIACAASFTCFRVGVCVASVLAWESAARPRPAAFLIWVARRTRTYVLIRCCCCCSQVWRLPEPGFLEGVKSKDKAILKVHNMSFTYPGSAKPQISGVSLQVSLSSRVACVGPNGAGKSTLIKVWRGVYRSRLLLLACLLFGCFWRW